MGAPQIIFIVIWSINLACHALKHGEPRTDKYNVLAAIISLGLNVLLLWWGGFF